MKLKPKDKGWMRSLSILALLPVFMAVYLWTRTQDINDILWVPIPIICAAMLWWYSNNVEKPKIQGRRKKRKSAADE